MVIHMFTVHILLKPGLENFEHFFTSMWDECDCAVVWAFFGIAFLWDWASLVAHRLKSLPAMRETWVQSLAWKDTLEKEMAAYSSILAWREWMEEPGGKIDLFQSCGHLWVFPIHWHIEYSTFTASSFRIWNSSTGIPSHPLALFVVMLPKSHLTSQSRISGSRWVITPSWVSEL